MADHNTGRRVRRRRGGRQGSTLVVTTLGMLGLAVVGVSVARLSQTANRVSQAGSNKVQATMLAETGMQRLYDRMRSDLETAPAAAPSTALAATTLSGTVGGTTHAVGTYSARSRVVSDQMNEERNASGTLTGYRRNITFWVEGTGDAGSLTAATTSRVSAMMDGVIRYGVATTGGSAGGTPAFGNGALQANGKIKFTTNGGLDVRDAGPGRNDSDIVANEGIGWTPQNGQRGNANPNTIAIQGQLLVPRSPNPAWSYTTSNTTGLYDSGSGRVFSSHAGGDGTPANQLAPLAQPRSFPNETQVNEWKTEWLAAATGAGSTRWNGGISGFNAIPSRTANPGQGERRITAPAYIDGDLVIDQQQVYLQPNSNLALPNVIYVKGNVRNASLLYNRGVKLIVEGSFIDTTNSALYSLQLQYSPYASDHNGNFSGSGNNNNNSGTNRRGSGWDGIYRDAALVTLAKSRTAVTMNTDSSGPAGLIYAALGGMVINGTNEVGGAFIAGGGADPNGTGTLGDIDVRPRGGNSWRVWYHDEAVQGRSDMVVAVPSGPGAVMQAFTPTRRLYDWVQSR